MRFQLLVFIFLFGLSCLKAENLLEKNIPNKNEVIHNYLKKLRGYKKQLCGNREDSYYDELYTEYRQFPYFLPSYKNEILIRTLAAHTKLIQDKVDWMEEEALKLRTNKHSFKNYNKRLSKLEKEFQLIRNNKNPRERNIIFKKLKEKIASFLSDLSFIHTYKFPLDLEKLRVQSEYLKSNDEKSYVSFYFFRKILEEGAPVNKKRSDFSIRALISMVSIRLLTEDKLTEDLIYDLDDLFPIISRILRKKTSVYEKRLVSWKKRTENYLSFIESLLLKNKKSEVQITKHNANKNLLKDFVLKQHALSYDFWTRQPDIYKYLFVMETILYNEVGGAIDKNQEERKRIIQVVLNRYMKPEYSSFLSTDDIIDYLSSKRSLKDGKGFHRWLNILFKEGEFSFTYFYIRASRFVFCPDYSRRGKSLRLENLMLALDGIEKPNWNFKGVRYFSRISMPGRIDMSSAWKDFKPMPESPGPRLAEQEKLRLDFKNSKFLTRYHFVDDKKEVFKVLEKNEKRYVLRVKDFTFFKYQDPHYFRYFY